MLEEEVEEAENALEKAETAKKVQTMLFYLKMIKIYTYWILVPVQKFMRSHHEGTRGSA